MKNLIFSVYKPVDIDRKFVDKQTNTIKQFEKYFGSSTLIKEYTDNDLYKEVIFESEKKNEAKVQEFLLQWQQRDDPDCLNDMIHIRLRLKHLQDFQPITWEPRDFPA